MTTLLAAPRCEVRLDSPIGTLVLGGDDEVLRHIRLPIPQRAPRSLPWAGEVDLPDAVAATVVQLEEYFAGARHRFDLPMALEGTAFQRDVWLALADIPWGHTISYAELAEAVGRPTAFRAVGQANGANPIPIVLPCHRVLASGGRIGGFGGGLPMKRQLLALEGVEV